MSELPETGGAPAGAVAEPDPRVGMLLDARYRLLRRLGAGGFGAVYEAEHVGIRRKVAVKVLHAHVAADADMIVRFKREAIAATATGHPHIVEVMDLGRTPDGGAYMVLELLTGTEWGAQLETQGPQPVGRTVRIVRQVLDGLAAAHDKGIVHRDLKAENVFLVPKDGDPDFVKVVDFGISKMREEGASPEAGVTHTGMALGTPAAMAPEQFQGKKDVDARADLWAIGVMLYRALAARWPFEGDTYAMLAVDVMTGEPPPLHAIRPDVPEALSALVARLLAKDRARRPQTAREVRDALAPFEAEPGPAPRHDTIDVLAATQAVPAVPPPPSAGTVAPSTVDSPAVGPARSSWLLAVAGLALVGIAGWAVFVASDVDRTEADTTTSTSARGDAGVGTGALDAAAGASAASARGRLLVLTTPTGCVVSEDGEALGISPLDLELAAGTHALALDCPAQGLAGTTEVVVESGRTARAVVRLEPDAGTAPGRRGHGEHGAQPATGHEPTVTEAVGAPVPTEVVHEPEPPPTTGQASEPPPTTGHDSGRGQPFLRPGGI